MYSHIVKNTHRRQNKLLTPFLYFMVEVAGFWILISLWQVSFNIVEWSALATGMLCFVSFPFFLKMLEIYRRKTDEKTRVLYYM